MTKRIAFLLVATGLLLGAAQAGAEGAHAIFGRLKIGDKFNRPVEDGSSLSTIGTQVYYTVQPFFVSEPAHCWIRSTQWNGIHGMLFLYQDEFDKTSPLANFVTGDAMAAGGIGTNEIANVAVTYLDNWYLVTTTWDNGETGSYLNTLQCQADADADRDVFVVTGDRGITDYDGTRNLFNNGRFRVEGTWQDYSSNTGDAYFVPLSSNDTGILYFFNPTNWEVMIKVLNGCPINNRYWVYLAATTDVAYTITVRDMEAGIDSTYSNTLGTQSPAFTDSDAFATCP